MIEKIDIEHKEQMCKLNKQYRLANRKSILDHYGYYCYWCYENDEATLQIDHKLNNGNKERKSNEGSDAFYRRVIKEGFPDCYQILCSCCNKGKYINKGIMPEWRKDKYKYTNLPKINSASEANNGK